MLAAASTENEQGAKDGAPFHVALLGLGPSVTQYLEITKRAGGRRAFSDETWTLNSLGDVFACDRVFHMDDVRVQMMRAEKAPTGNIAAMVDWLRRHPGPVMTSRIHPDFPGLVAFPLEAVVNDLGYVYFNSTAAYAVAYAIHIGVRKLTLFGFDFTYPNAHHAEKGRACVEFYLGIAAARGITIAIPRESSLMDGCLSQSERCYGYDTQQIAVEVKEGRAVLSFTDKEPPSVDEIEAAYDHNEHPNPLVEDA